MKNITLIIFAVLGLGLAVGAIILGNHEITPPPPAVKATQAPYTQFIAGAGLIESSTENIAITTPVSGIVSDIYVNLGDKVEAGTPLFKIDTRDLEAELLPLRAAIGEKKGVLGNADADLTIAKKAGGSVSKELLSERKFEVSIASAGLKKAQAEVERLNIEIDRRTIEAPMAGSILQIKTHLGEFADSNITTDKPPLMMMGNIDVLHARVDIDEYDAWRFDKDQPAVAFVRGIADVKIPLKFVRVEPYIIPKKSLTGNSAERTDTRVLQAIYSLAPKEGLYIGEQLDVYIKAPLKTSNPNTGKK